MTVTRRTKRTFFFVVVGLLAVGIVGSIAWLVWYDMNEGRTPPTSGGDDNPFTELAARNLEADIWRTRRTVQVDGFLGTCLARLHYRAGRYPDSLKDLLKKPPDWPASHWDGPYVSTLELLNDPWNRPYQYRYPGVHSLQSYDLWSVGPDGVNGTADDISNW